MFPYLVLKAHTTRAKKTLGLVELRIEKSEVVLQDWWSFYVTYWIHKGKYWREWLWEWEYSPYVPMETTWGSWSLRVCGLELGWQRRYKQPHDIERSI